MVILFWNKRVLGDYLYPHPSFVDFEASVHVCKDNLFLNDFTIHEGSFC